MSLSFDMGKLPTSTTDTLADRGRDLAPDLQILVSQEDENDGVRISYKLKAREPSIGLNYADCGSRKLPRQPETILREALSRLDSRGADNVQERLEVKSKRLTKELLSRELLTELIRIHSRVKTVQVIGEEALIPWEILRLLEPVGRRGFRDGPFLSEAFALTRWIPDIPEQLHLPIRHLAVIAAAGGDRTLAVEEERDFILSLVGPGRQVDAIPARRTDLVEALAEADYDAWHFTGHAVEHSKDPEGAGLRLLDYGKVTAEDLHGAAGEMGQCGPFVFLNACNTGRGGPGLKEWSGWSRRLLEAGAGAFIGTSWAISDEPAALFARSFYSSFLGGQPIGEAVRRARLEVREQFPTDATWLAYNVYAHPLASCRELEKSDDVAGLLELQEAFALLRLLEVWQSGQGIRVRLDASGERFDLEKDGKRETWTLSSRPLDVDSHLARLAALREDGEGYEVGEILGSVQRGGLDLESSRLATFFEELRACRDLGEEMVRELVWETAKSPVIDRAIRTLTGRQDVGFQHFDLSTHVQPSPGSLFRFTRFELRGTDPQQLRRRTLDLLAARLRLNLLGDEGEASLYAHHAGAALLLLRTHHGREIPGALLVDALHATAAGSTVPVDPAATAAGVKRWRTASQAIADQTVHARKVRLRQLFVRPRARFLLADGRHAPERVADAYVWLWQALIEDRRAFTLILGDFGHGKTTLLRYLTSALAAREEPEAPIPVYLSLSRVAPHHTLREAVGQEMAEHGLRLTEALWSGRSWVLLCDGFDELGIVHHERMDAVALRFTTLVRASRRPNIQVVVASRPILFLDPGVRRDTVECFDRLELDPFDDEQISTWLTKWSEVETAISFGALAGRGLLEVARTPVLLLMIAMMFHEELGTSRETFSRAKIYGRFFDWTARSGGLTEPGAPRKHPVPQGYREILREIAWILFTHPDAGSGLIRYETLLAELRARFSHWNAARGDVLDERLFVAHAFHENRPHHIEFIHQSLREYLVAEKLLEVYRGLSTAAPEDDAAYETILCDKPLTLAKIRFFRELLEDLDEVAKRELLPLGRNRSHWPTLLYQLAKKASPRMTSYDVYRFSRDHLETVELFPENHVVVANLSLLGFLFETWLANDLGELEETFPQQLLCLQHLLASDPRLDGVYELLYHALEKLSFENLHFKGVDFDGFELEGWYVAGSLFEHCSFSDTNLRSSQFTGTERRTSFEDCVLDRLKLNHIDWCGIDFVDCTFNNLSGQSGSKFRDIVYRRCRFVDCGIVHFYRGGAFEACTFFNTEPMPPVLSTPDEVDIRFEHCLAYDPAVGWRPVNQLKDLVAEEAPSKTSEPSKCPEKKTFTESTSSAGRRKA